MWEDVNCIFLLSDSIQTVSDLAEAWVICMWREEERSGKSGRKEGKVREKGGKGI